MLKYYTNVQVQLTLEQHEFELPGSTYIQIFFLNKYTEYYKLQLVKPTGVELRMQSASCGSQASQDFGVCGVS